MMGYAKKIFMSKGEVNRSYRRDVGRRRNFEEFVVRQGGTLFLQKQPSRSVYGETARHERKYDPATTTITARQI